MRIEELIAACPRFSRVSFHVEVQSAELFVHAAAGDALHLVEVNLDGLTGKRITALVLDCEAAVRADSTALRALAESDS